MYTNSAIYNLLKNILIFFDLIQISDETSELFSNYSLNEVGMKSNVDLVLSPRHGKTSYSHVNQP